METQLPGPTTVASGSRTTGRRDRSRDGLRYRAELHLSTNYGRLWRTLGLVPPVRRALNQFVINNVVGKAAARPYRLSTKADHTSWESLVDRSYSGRHLPPGRLDLRSLPTVAEVGELFTRPEDGAILSDKSTLLFPIFAQWFVDGFLRTDPLDVRRNTSTHEIDLSQLYGQTPEITSLLRSGRGGRLKSQIHDGEELPCFYYRDDGEARPDFLGLRIEGAEDSKDESDDDHPDRRLQHFALGIHRGNLHYGMAMMSTLFLREHNRLCDVIARAHPGWTDDRLFDAARAVLTVMLIKIVIEEYINHISPYVFDLFLQPGVGAREKWYRQNWISIEFNLLYRWHALVPDEVVVGGRNRPFEELRWDVNPLLETDLGSLFEEASAQPSAAMGLYNTPAFLVPAEEAALRIGREAQLASYNDYRELCGFPRARAFDQISGRADVQRGLRHRYRTVDRIELVPGLFAEDLIPNSPLPPLMALLVGVDAFSQALTNPLLAENVYGPDTFSKAGMAEIERTRCLADLVERNVRPVGHDRHISLTLGTWKRS